MTNVSRITGAALAATLGLSLALPRPAAADGAASTRNILFGAAAVGGTLLILNHNKKVHEKYAEYDRQQAATEEQRNQAQAAYESERSAYAHEAALVADYKNEVAYQHKIVGQQNGEIAQLKHSLALSPTGAPGAAAFVQPARVAAAPVRGSAPAPQVVSYGWGNL
jgi:hypothetical protein